LILIVDDAEEFHKENFDQNNKHYSGFSKRLPLSVTSNFVQRSGSKLYFNPLIPLKTFKSNENPDLFSNDARRLKYGIIQKEDAIEDLT
tara:strand:+ start:620 stop:886 length:267 start_codon:yes stop_codon:yes gene_type:complete